MRRSKAEVLALVCLALSFSTFESRASDPVGVYGIVKKMVFEPNESAPQRVQIWGAFALSDGKSGDGYLAPQQGYLYYRLTTGKEDICRMEWADLMSVAGTGQAVGFGFRYDTQTRLRQPTENAGAPDHYPLGVGVMKIGNGQRQHAVIAQIRKALKPE
jgi:hypothetical protein